MPTVVPQQTTPYCVRFVIWVESLQSINVPVLDQICKTRREFRKPTRPASINPSSTWKIRSRNLTHMRKVTATRHSRVKRAVTPMIVDANPCGCICAGIFAGTLAAAGEAMTRNDESIELDDLKGEVVARRNPPDPRSRAHGSEARRLYLHDANFPHMLKQVGSPVILPKVAKICPNEQSWWPQLAPL